MNKKEGYVTFADILGWKGIWRIKKDPVEELLDIRSKVINYIEDILIKYELSIIENEFPEYYAEGIKDKLNIYGIKDVEKEILEYIKNKNIDKTITDEDKPEEQREKENEKIKEESRNFKKEFDEFKVYISLDLISDTFVITSYSKNKEKELFLHSRISQVLIDRCLEHKLLIRGATSYGDYYKEKLVFVGPAIDDAASWHELSEEIGIYFTPKALLRMIKNNITKNNLWEKEFYYKTNKFQRHKNLLEIIFWSRPKLKIESFDTYLINWKDSEESFWNTITEYKTILPDVYKKVIYSIRRLESLEYRLDGSAETGTKIMREINSFKYSLIKVEMQEDNNYYKFKVCFYNQVGTFVIVCDKYGKIFDSSTLNMNGFIRPLGLYNDESLYDVANMMLGNK